MATCYRCGAKTSNHQRLVFLKDTPGKSIDWHSSRSVGLRKVCKKCARSIDRRTTIRGFTFLLFILTVIYLLYEL